MSDKALTSVELEATQRLQRLFPRGLPDELVHRINSSPANLLALMVEEMIRELIARLSGKEFVVGELSRLFGITEPEIQIGYFLNSQFLQKFDLELCDETDTQDILNVYHHLSRLGLSIPKVGFTNRIQAPSLTNICSISGGLITAVQRQWLSNSVSSRSLWVFKKIVKPSVKT